MDSVKMEPAAKRVAADLVIAEGHVIDPANGFDGPADVIVIDGKIAAVGKGLAAE